MIENNFLEQKEERISFQIFGVSATMVGVCFTVLGLFSIFHTLKKVQSLIDEFITVDAILFLASCFVSYIAIRTKDKKSKYNLEKVADGIFLLALSVIVLICILFVFEFI